jgi:hypothetical protein
MIYKVQSHWSDHPQELYISESYLINYQPTKEMTYNYGQVIKTSSSECLRIHIILDTGYHGRMDLDRYIDGITASYCFVTNPSH